YRYICCQPHLLDAIAELNVVTSPEFIERLRPICADRLTDDANPRTPRQGLYLSNEHQRLEITLILPETGCKLGDSVSAFGSRYLRAEHIGVLDIILFTRELAHRLYGKPTAFSGIQQSAENERAVKRGPA